MPEAGEHPHSRRLHSEPFRVRRCGTAFLRTDCCLFLSESARFAQVGGNVLTSQRIVDVILKAFGACAASQGTLDNVFFSRLSRFLCSAHLCFQCYKGCMNNLTFGDESFGYYETIAGGAGAGPSWDGRSGVHTHMTNTRITDPEILEKRYPVLLREVFYCPVEQKLPKCYVLLSVLVLFLFFSFFSGSA